MQNKKLEIQQVPGLQQGVSLAPSMNICKLIWSLIQYKLCDGYKQEVVSHP